MRENWKDIEGYEGLYQVSDTGEVKSLARHFTNSLGVTKFYPGRILAQRLDRAGYKLIDLRNGTVKKTYKVHRLVASAFIPNPLFLPEVNHKKEFEKSNNCIDNLEWMTSKQNMNYGTLGDRIAKIFSKTVYQYDLEYNLIKQWQSSKECGRNGFPETCVRRCCDGITKSYKGFIWSHKEL
jgi:hypothetical protein